MLLTNEQATGIAFDAVKEYGILDATEDTVIFDPFDGFGSRLDSLASVEVLLYCEDRLERDYGVKVDIQPGTAKTVGSLRDFLLTL